MSQSVGGRPVDRSVAWLPPKHVGGTPMTNLLDQPRPHLGARSMRGVQRMASARCLVLAMLLAATATGSAAAQSPSAPAARNADVVCPEGTPTRGNGKKQFAWAIGLSELPIIQSIQKRDHPAGCPLRLGGPVRHRHRRQHPVDDPVRRGLDHGRCSVDHRGALRACGVGVAGEASRRQGPDLALLQPVDRHPVWHVRFWPVPDAPS